MNFVTSLPEHFSEFERHLNGDSKFAFHNKRKAAVAEYQKNGFPNSKMEEWKYTDPSVIEKSAYPLLNKYSAPASIEIAQSFWTPNLDSYRLVILNGQLISTAADLPKGVTCTTLKQAQATGGNLLEAVEKHLGVIASSTEAFVALNTALSSDATIIMVADNICIDKPIQMLCLSNSDSALSTTLPRTLVLAGQNSEFCIIERCETTAMLQEQFINSVLEFAVARDARVTHYRLQNESLEALLVSSISASLEEKANFTTFTFSFGGKLVRNHVNVVLNGKDCNVTMNGLSAINGEQHVDNQTMLDNAQPNCESLELYKGIYADSSQGVFSGTIIVRQIAQKTNAIQSNRSLLLSDKASVNTKPQLKIWADDVKCTHGATIGQLDEEALFYLKTRGINEKDAKVMLVHAFASEIISAVKITSLKDNLEDLLITKLQLDANV
jgi:Fe-S cluster assembly protein SufD